jgi:hypothetical protein
MSTSLLREFFADFKVRTPKFNTLCMIHRPFSNHLRIKKVDQCIDFALDQCGGRVGHGQTSRSEIGLPETVAAPVAVAETVERRHAGPGTATFNGRDQVFTVKLGLAQIRAIGYLIVHLSAVTGQPWHAWQLAFCRKSWPPAAMSEALGVCPCTAVAVMTSKVATAMLTAERGRDFRSKCV